MTTDQKGTTQMTKTSNLTPFAYHVTLPDGTVRTIKAATRYYTHAVVVEDDNGFHAYSDHSSEALARKGAQKAERLGRGHGVAWAQVLVLPFDNQRPTCATCGRLVGTRRNGNLVHEDQRLDAVDDHGASLERPEAEVADQVQSLDPDGARWYYDRMVQLEAQLADRDRQLDAQRSLVLDVQDLQRQLENARSEAEYLRDAKHQARTDATAAKNELVQVRERLLADNRAAGQELHRLQGLLLETQAALRQAMDVDEDDPMMDDDPPVDEYDPGPEVDDEGGMSEFRHAGMDGTC